MAHGKGGARHPQRSGVHRRSPTAFSKTPGTLEAPGTGARLLGATRHQDEPAEVHLLQSQYALATDAAVGDEVNPGGLGAILSQIDAKGNHYAINSELPSDWSLKDVKLKAAEGCFIEDNVIWKRIRRPNEPPRVVIYLPRRLIPSVLKEAHGTLLSGHNGILKTKERFMQCYFWPGMETDIQQHIQQCCKCQVRCLKRPGC